MVYTYEEMLKTEKKDEDKAECGWCNMWFKAEELTLTEEFNLCKECLKERDKKNI